MQALLSRMNWRTLSRTWLVAWAVLCASLSLPAQAAGEAAQYKIGAGDVLRISVYQSQDLSLELRLSESGEASYPLLGTIRLGGLTVSQAEQYLVNALKNGGFIRNPQVMVNVIQVRSNFVNVLGQVNRPGRFPLDIAGIKLSEMLAQAGGLSADSSEIIRIVGNRNGSVTYIEVDLPSLFVAGGNQTDIVMQPGDSIWVDRAPMAYVYGEVNRPGPMRIMRNMTVMQALATAGGTTPRGTLKGMKLNRQDVKTGKTNATEPVLDDRLQDGDVLYIRESLF